MSIPPVEGPRTLDTWVAKLEQKRFEPDKQRIALANLSNLTLTFFEYERSFTLPKVPPEHVAIMKHIGHGEYEKDGATTTVHPGDFAVFYTNYERKPPIQNIDTMGFFNSQGEPLDDAGRGIQARLFD